MKLISQIGLIALAAALLGGCCACRAKQKKSQKPLIGTEWQCVQLNGRTLQPADDQYTIRLLPEENRFTGVGSCNRITAVYKLGENRALTLEYPASTRMLCPDGATEEAFLKALTETTHYDMDGATLMLFANGDLVALFRAKSDAGK